MPPQPTANTVTPTIYLVALDGTPSSTHVLEVACMLGGALGGAAELHIVHVLNLTPPLVAMGMAAYSTPTDLQEVGRMVLDRACAEAVPRFGGRIVGHLTAGEAWREILRTAVSLRADLIVVGTAGKTGVARLALGSVAEKVVRHAECPVLVARPKDYPQAPEIAQPCLDCVAVQNKTARAQLWCSRHSIHHPHGRLHYEVPPSFAVGTMLLRPQDDV